MSRAGISVVLLFCAARVVQDDGEIQAEIRNMRERAPGIESERRENGKNGFEVVAVDGLTFAVVESSVIGNGNAVLRKFRQELILEAVVNLQHQLIDAGVHRFQLLR